VAVVYAPTNGCVGLSITAYAADVIFVAGGPFRREPDKHYPEVTPVHRVTVDGVWIDRAPVTSRNFRNFVNTTGDVTVAAIASGASAENSRKRTRHEQG